MVYLLRRLLPGRGGLDRDGGGGGDLLGRRALCLKAEKLFRDLISKRKQHSFSYFRKEGLWYGVVELQLKALDLLLPGKIVGAGKI